MRDFARIAPTFWTRGSGKRIRGDKEAQIVALYLMSSPATSMVGIFNLSLATLCNDTGLTPKEARKGLARVSEEGLGYLDEADELAWVPALARYQLGESMSLGRNGKPDHRIAGVKRALAPFKGHRFHGMFMDRYAEAYMLGDIEDEGALEGLASPIAYARVSPAQSPAPASGSGTRAKRWRRVPAEWQPNQKHREQAASLGLDFGLELESFRDHEFDRPKSDADATFRNWLRNARRFGSIASAPPTEQPAGESDAQRRNRERIEAERKAKRERDAAEIRRLGLTEQGDPAKLVGGIGNG